MFISQYYIVCWVYDRRLEIYKFTISLHRLLNLLNSTKSSLYYEKLRQTLLIDIAKANFSFVLFLKASVTLNWILRINLYS